MYVTETDGLDILHLRSPHADGLPMTMTHGRWSSILELTKVIGPVVDPTRHGGSAADAFHLVVPSIPGFGFSGNRVPRNRAQRCYKNLCHFSAVRNGGHFPAWEQP